MDPDAAEIFRPLLRPGERLRWTGRPDPRRWFGRGDLLLVPMSLAWGGIAIFGAGSMSGAWGDVPAAHGAPWWIKIPPMLFGIAGLHMIAGRFLFKWLRKRRTWYAVTDARALVVFRGRSEVIQTAVLRHLDAITLTRGMKGSGTIRFGPAPPQGWMYENSGMEFFGAVSFTSAPAFFDVAEAKDVFDLARSAADADRRRMEAERGR